MDGGVHLIEKIGRGTYGTVWKAFHADQNLVAVKRLNMRREMEGFPFTSVREVKILQSTQHPNIIQLTSITNHGSARIDASAIDLIFPYMEHDLAGLIDNPAVSIPVPVAKFYLHQILLGLQYLHANRIMHRDIKSSNILVSNSGAVRIADFGLARFASVDVAEYTNRVVTLWYRPPELLLGQQAYDYSVDLWAVGCIMVELLTRSHPFPATTELDLLDRIFRLCGTPTPKSWPVFQDLPWYPHLKPAKSRPSRVFDVYQKLSADALDLIAGLLCPNPETRLTAVQALSHDFFSSYPLPIDIADHPRYPQSHEYKSKQLRMRKRRDSASLSAMPKPASSLVGSPVANR